MSTERIRVILMLHGSLAKEVRDELGALLLGAGWTAASDDATCYVCRAQPDDLAKMEHRVRKSIEFAAFTSGHTGRFPFVLKIGESDPKALAARIGGVKTEPVKRNSGLDFATERIADSRPALPKELRSPNVTQLKTAI